MLFLVILTSFTDDKSFEPVKQSAVIVAMIIIKIVSAEKILFFLHNSIISVSKAPNYLIFSLTPFTIANIVQKTKKCNIFYTLYYFCMKQQKIRFYLILYIIMTNYCLKH